LATLAKMERITGWRDLESRTAAFANDLRARFSRVRGAPSIVHHSSMLWFVWPSRDAIRRPDRIPPEQAEWFKKYFHAALARGVYLPPAAFEVSFLSMAHNAGTLANAADALTAAAEEAGRS
jgi:glutamate-1-semialdehyde 2,1-aminomutase